MSSPVTRALARVDRGETPYAAALAEGVSPSTIYRRLAMARDPEYAARVRRANAERSRAHRRRRTQT